MMKASVGNSAGFFVFLFSLKSSFQPLCFKAGIEQVFYA
ncbi:hypothetical protein PEC301899_23380 [Pectobacterium carotovorum subsp. carotovorum]|nr:hypothetical protein PEC301899_23380 [Pectobacterium carotovorum subsp. carotovorum]